MIKRKKSRRKWIKSWKKKKHFLKSKWLSYSSKNSTSKESAATNVNSKSVLKCLKRSRKSMKTSTVSGSEYFLSASKKGATVMNNVGKNKWCARPNKKSFRKGIFSKNRKNNCRLSMKLCKMYRISSRKFLPLHNSKKKSRNSVWVDLRKW